MAKAGRWTTVLALTLAALAAAGCGGGDTQELSREEFEQELSSAQTAIEESLGSISASDVGDPDALAQRLDEVATQIRDTATDLGAQDVPAEAEEPTERLVDNLQEFADELEDVSAAVEEGGVQSVLDAAQDLQNSDAARQVQQALDDLREAGFEFGTTQ